MPLWPTDYELDVETLAEELLALTAEEALDLAAWLLDGQPEDVDQPTDACPHVF